MGGGSENVDKIFLYFLRHFSLEKPLLKTLLKVNQCRTTSTTGKNLRKIMLLQGVNHIEEIQVDKDIPYFPLPEEEVWKGSSCGA